MQNYPPITPYTQTQMSQPVVYPQNNSGATLNIGTPATNYPNVTQPNGANNINSSNGVTINIIGASVNPNGANIYNAAPQAPVQSYGRDYYMNNMANPMQQTQPTVPVGAAALNNNEKEKKDVAKKDIVLLTDEYIKTLENYLRNDNPDIKLMGAKELMKRFREDESRKNDQALTNLLNLTLQSKYSPVKTVGLGILQNGWAQGDGFTQQLLSQIQQTSSGYGLDALDAADAALKTAGKTIKVVDNNPPKSKNKTEK